MVGFDTISINTPIILTFNPEKNEKCHIKWTRSRLKRVDELLWGDSGCPDFSHDHAGSRIG